MAGKKHPILTVLLILGISGLLLGALLVLVLKLFAPPAALVFKDKVGVIEIEGVIGASEKITASLADFKADEKIRGVILRINSPGGSVGPSQEIYTEVRKTAREKPVVASMGAVAASGGYYVAAGANKIVANPGTITGSIGVLMEFVQLEGLLKKIGIRLEVLKSGEFKDLGSPHRELTERDKEIIRGVMQDIQQQFVAAVAEGRNLPEGSVRKIADGRIFSGAQAKDLGLVDLLGNMQDAIALTKELAGIEGEVTLVYPKKPKLSLWNWVFGGAKEALFELLAGSKTQIEYRWEGLSRDGSKENY
jgi:protease-4